MGNRRQARRQRRYDRGGGVGRGGLFPNVFPGKNYRKPLTSKRPTPIAPAPTTAAPDVVDVNEDAGLLSEYVNDLQLAEQFAAPESQRSLDATRQVLQDMSDPDTFFGGQFPEQSIMPIPQPPAGGGVPGFSIDPDSDESSLRQYAEWVENTPEGRAHAEQRAGMTMEEKMHEILSTGDFGFSGFGFDPDYETGPDGVRRWRPEALDRIRRESEAEDTTVAPGDGREVVVDPAGRAPVIDGPPDIDEIRGRSIGGAPPPLAPRAPVVPDPAVVIAPPAEGIPPVARPVASSPFISIDPETGRPEVGGPIRDAHLEELWSKSKGTDLRGSLLKFDANNDGVWSDVERDAAFSSFTQDAQELGYRSLAEMVQDSEIHKGEFVQKGQLGLLANRDHVPDHLSSGIDHDGDPGTPNVVHTPLLHTSKHHIKNPRVYGNRGEHYIKPETFEQLGVPRAYWQEINKQLQNKSGEFYARLGAAEGGVINPDNPRGPGNVTWDHDAVAAVVNEVINQVYDMHAEKGVRAPHIDQRGEFDSKGRHKQTRTETKHDILRKGGIDPTKRRPLVRHKSQEEKERDYIAGKGNSSGLGGVFDSGFGRTPRTRQHLMETRVGPNHKRSMANEVNRLNREENVGIYTPGGTYEKTGYATRQRILDATGKGSTQEEKQQIALDKSNAAFDEYLGLGFSQAQSREMATRIYKQEFRLQNSGVQ